mgnify:CR=1 FL=1
MKGIIDFILGVFAFILVTSFWILPILMTWGYNNKGFLLIYVVYYIVLRILYKLAIRKL